MKRLFFISVITIISFNFIEGQPYKVVYSNGFEDGEDITGIYLDASTYYATLEDCPNSNPNQIAKDYFNIGNADAYEGNKSLYLSNDGGLTNIVYEHLSDGIYHICL